MSVRSRLQVTSFQTMISYLTQQLEHVAFNRQSVQECSFKPFESKHVTRNFAQTYRKTRFPRFYWIFPFGEFLKQSDFLYAVKQKGELDCCQQLCPTTLVRVLRGETRLTLQFLPGTASKGSDPADPTHRCSSCS